MKLLSNRYIAILITLGLILQPLGMVVSAKRMSIQPETMDMPVITASTSMNASMLMNDSEAPVPCHEEGQVQQDDSAMGDQCSGCCDMGCLMMNQCGLFNTLFALGDWRSLEMNLHENTGHTPYAALSVGKPSTSIYHPPRRS